MNWCKKDESCVKTSGKDEIRALESLSNKKEDLKKSYFNRLFMGNASLAVIMVSVLFILIIAGSFLTVSVQEIKFNIEDEQITHVDLNNVEISQLTYFLRLQEKGDYTVYIYDLENEKLKKFSNLGFGEHIVYLKNNKECISIQLVTNKLETKLDLIENACVD